MNSRQKLGRNVRLEARKAAKRPSDRNIAKAARIAASIGKDLAEVGKEFTDNYGTENRKPAGRMMTFTYLTQERFAQIAKLLRKR